MSFGEYRPRMIKLDLGCGPHRLPGYIPIDDSLGHDVRALPFRDGSVDEIRASHVLEHIPYREAQPVLEHWFNLLNISFVSLPTPMSTIT